MFSHTDTCYTYVGDNQAFNLIYSEREQIIKCHSREKNVIRDKRYENAKVGMRWKKWVWDNTVWRGQYIKQARGLSAPTANERLIRKRKIGWERVSEREAKREAEREVCEVDFERNGSCRGRRWTERENCSETVRRVAGRENALAQSMVIVLSSLPLSSISLPKWHMKNKKLKMKKWKRNTETIYQCPFRKRSFWEWILENRTNNWREKVGKEYRQKYYARLLVYYMNAYMRNVRICSTVRIGMLWPDLALRRIQLK